MSDRKYGFLWNQQYVEQTPQSHISLISADKQNNKKAEEKGISSCFRYGYVYIRMHRIKELRSSKRMELFKHHFMQISMMNCAHAHEQHVFVYNI